MDLKELKLPEGVTKEQMDVQTKQNGRLIVVNVTGFEGDILSVVFKQPGRDIISAVFSKSKKNEFEAMFFLYDNCKIFEDSDIASSDLLKMSAAQELGKLIKSFRTNRQFY